MYDSNAISKVISTKSVISGFKITSTPSKSRNQNGICHSRKMKNFQSGPEKAIFSYKTIVSAVHVICDMCIADPVMTRNGYEKISSDGKKQNVSLFSLLFFQWINSVFKTGSKRPLQQSDFLQLPNRNIACSIIKQLKANWNNEIAKCKADGRRPKLWKSVIKMLSFKESVFLVFTRILYSLCRIIQPLLLGYLMSSLMSTEPRANYLLYACALAMGVNALIGCVTMHHFDYKCELLGNRLSSALKGVIYVKVSAFLFCYFSAVL